MIEQASVARQADRAILTLEVWVDLECEPGINTPDAFESAYDYLAIREVLVTNERYVHAPTGEEADGRWINHLAQHDGTDDLEPDGLMVEAVSMALMGPQGEEDDWH